jgi:hypothetical protein
MGDIEEVYVGDLYKKHNGKELYNGFYTVGKNGYQDNGEVANESIALDREALEILRAKIMAILIDESPKRRKPGLNPVNPNRKKYSKNSR